MGGEEGEGVAPVVLMHHRGHIAVPIVHILDSALPLAPQYLPLGQVQFQHRILACQL